MPGWCGSGTQRRGCGEERSRRPGTEGTLNTPLRNEYGAVNTRIPGGSGQTIWRQGNGENKGMKRGKNDTSVSCQSLRRLTVTTPRILRIFRDAWPPGRPGKQLRNGSALAIEFHIRGLAEDGPPVFRICDDHPRVITACMPDDEY